MDFEVEFYEDSRGRKPVEEFLREIRVKNKILWTQIVKTIEKIQDRRYHGEPLSKHLTGDLLEIRVKAGTNIARIIYTFAKGKRIILLAGFIKKTQKTPAGELKLAEQRLKDLKERNK